LAALHGYIKVRNEIYADPSAKKDWTAEVREFTADPEAHELLAIIPGLVKAGVHQVVPAGYENPHVTKVLGGKGVQIQLCLDVGQWRIKDADGTVHGVGAENPRAMFAVNVYPYDPPNSPWLVSETAYVDPIEKC
jgi:hypothetical protein